MDRLAIASFAVGFGMSIAGAVAQEHPKPLLSQQQINDLIAKLNKNQEFKPTPLCGFGAASPSCRVFALPNPSFGNALKSDSNLFKPAAPFEPRPPAAPLTVACPKDDHFHTCHVIDSLTDIGPGQVGATLYLGGSRSAELSKKASQGLLMSGEVKGLISEKTIGLLPEAVETSAAERAVGVLAKSGIAKTGRGAAVVGVALMTYAAYEYFFGKSEKPADHKDPAK
jgi:hypothetical protein